MVQGLAVGVMEVLFGLFVVTIKSIRVYRTSIVRLFNLPYKGLSRLFPHYKIYNRLLVLIVLLGISRPRADVVFMPMIPAFGEILVSADRADGARPPLSSTHYGLQRQCDAGGDQRSAAFGSPAELASPIRLGYMSARQSAEAARPARLKGKRYGRLCRGKPATDSHLVRPPGPQGR